MQYLMEFITAEVTIKTLIQPKEKNIWYFTIHLSTNSITSQNLEFYFCNRQMNKRVQTGFAFGSKSLDLASSTPSLFCHPRWKGFPEADIQTTNSSTSQYVLCWRPNLAEGDIF